MFHLKLGMHVTVFSPFLPQYLKRMTHFGLNFVSLAMLSMQCTRKSKGQLSAPRRPLDRQINFWQILVGRLTSPYEQIPQQHLFFLTALAPGDTVWKCHGDTTLIAGMMIATEQQRTLALLTMAIVVANVASLPSFLSAKWTSHTVHIFHVFWESIWEGNKS